MTGAVELAGRVEGVLCGDRELDVAVFRAIGAPVPLQFANRFVALAYDETEQCYFAPVGDMRVRYEPPAYTASLDAAMSLVPEGVFETVVTGAGTRRSFAQLIYPKRQTIFPSRHARRRASIYVRAATPALALCAAALRARASTPPVGR